MKVCVQGAAFETGNMGVNALAVGTVRCILHRYPEAEVFLLNYEKFSTVYTVEFPDRQVAVPLVNMRFSWRFWLRNNIAFLLFLTILMKLLPFPALRRRWIGGNECLRHLDQSDLVVAISGGDSFSDIYGLGRLIYVSLPQILALWAGKRLILLPQTLGPFKRRLARVIAKYIMKRAEVVCSRDHASVRLGAAMLGQKPGSRSQDSRFPSPKVRFCYDVGFLVDPMPPQHVDVVGLEFPPQAGSPRVGLNVSGLLFMGGYTRNNMFELKVMYDKLVYALVNLLVVQKRAETLLIPHVFGQSGESDSPICARIFETLKDKFPGKIGWVRGNYNQSEIKHVIGTCDFFIGSRMHACIAAISQNVPTVAIAYSDKFAGVMESVGVGSVVVDLRQVGEEEILNTVSRAFDMRDKVREQLAQTIPHVKETVLDLFSQFSGLRE